jgi:hypothetical protein
MPKKKRAEQQGRRQPKTSNVKADLRIAAAAHPSADLSFGPELEVVKAALLYGDRVTLLSPILTSFMRVETLESLTIHQQVDLARRVAPFLYDDPDEASQYELGLRHMERFLDGSQHAARLPAVEGARAEVLKKLEPIITGTT